MLKRKSLFLNVMLTAALTYPTLVQADSCLPLGQRIPFTAKGAHFNELKLLAGEIPVYKLPAQEQRQIDDEIGLNGSNVLSQGVVELRETHTNAIGKKTYTKDTQYATVELSVIPKGPADDETSTEADIEGFVTIKPPSIQQIAVWANNGQNYSVDARGGMILDNNTHRAVPPSPNDFCIRGIAIDASMHGQQFNPTLFFYTRAIKKPLTDPTRDLPVPAGMHVENTVKAKKSIDSMTAGLPEATDIVVDGKAAL